MENHCDHTDRRFRINIIQVPNSGKVVCWACLVESLQELAVDHVIKVTRLFE